jgi:AAA+ superfamily predicted ATPase
MKTEVIRYTPTNPPAILTKVRLLAQRRSLWLRYVWSNLEVEMPGEMVIADRELDYLVRDPQSLRTTEIAFYAHNREAIELSDQLQMVDRLIAEDLRWQRLQGMFDLSAPEQDLLALAIAIAVDPTIGRVYGYLQDDATAGYATPTLAAALFQWPDWQSFTPNSSLVRWHLAYPSGESRMPWATMVAWVADPAIVTWLMRGHSLDPLLGNGVHLIAPLENNCIPSLYPEQLAEMQEFIRSMRKIGQFPLAIELVGAKGSGKRLLAIQLCQHLEMPLLTVNAELLLGGEVSASLLQERSIRVVRQARLSKAVLYWHGLAEVPAQVWENQSRLAPLTLFSTAQPTLLPRQGCTQRVWRLPPLTSAVRIDLWRQLTKDLSIPAPIANWHLTPAEITNAARVALAGPEAVEAVCRQMVYQAPGELFTSLVCPYGWDDIVLTENVRQHLKELEQQAKWRSAVYEDWGFDRLSPMGQGMTSLFAGPSGTGKTMAAQVLAKSLGMELYRIDLAGVVNKYIGETEKRLKQVFDACQRSNVLPFFDEADALFGQRSQVKDAHDRYANIQIDYLLQRMEQFDGLAILATNRKGDLDKAFLRRLRFIVDFTQPGVVERLALWRLALPERSPAGELLLEGIRWELLAERLTMTGANIKAAALAAAFLARAAGSRITMRYVLHGAQREMTKHGVALRWEDWEDLGIDRSSLVIT